MGVRIDESGNDILAVNIHYRCIDWNFECSVFFPMQQFDCSVIRDVVILEYVFHVAQR